jgi:hypothetical protein
VKVRVEVPDVVSVSTKVGESDTTEVIERVFESCCVVLCFVSLHERVTDGDVDLKLVSVAVIVAVSDADAVGRVVRDRQRCCSNVVAADGG